MQSLIAPPALAHDNHDRKNEVSGQGSQSLALAPSPKKILPNRSLRSAAAAFGSHNSLGRLSRALNDFSRPTVSPTGVIDATF